MFKKLNHSPIIKKYHHSAGFTLIEILVVILIISVLISISIPSFLSIINQTKCRAELSNINIEVNREETIFGKIKGCETFHTSHQELKFYIYATGKQSYPYYYFPISVYGQKWDDQEWESSVIFGSEQDSGSSFKGGVTLTDPKDPKWSDYDADIGRNFLIGRRISSDDFLRK
jgi:prepilin-type N-terminal cleavage/methylation domain-containing protein